MLTELKLWCIWLGTVVLRTTYGLGAHYRCRNGLELWETVINFGRKSILACCHQKWTLQLLSLDMFGVEETCLCSKTYFLLLSIVKQDTSQYKPNVNYNKKDQIFIFQRQLFLQSQQSLKPFFYRKSLTDLICIYREI